MSYVFYFVRLKFIISPQDGSTSGPVKHSVVDQLVKHKLPPPPTPSTHLEPNTTTCDTLGGSRDGGREPSTSM